MEEVDAASPHILLLSLLGIFCVCIASESDISCLKSIKDSLEDHNNYLSSSWNFDNNTEGFICRFTAVDCWHPDENKVLNLRLGDFGLKGQFPRGLEKCKGLTGLDLSSNDLYGPLPVDIHKMLPSLTTLDVSFNNFSGEIPSSLAECTYLNSLKLDHNQLSGQIPQNIGQLGRLKTFCVANNLLSGPVPNFINSTISADSYANNRGLCGKPLDECKTHERRKFRSKFEYSFRSGLVIGYVAFTVSTIVVFVSYCVPWFHIGKKNKVVTVTEFIVVIIKKKKKKTNKNVVFDEEQTNILQTAKSKPQETNIVISSLEKIVGRMSFADLSNATKNFCSQNIIGVGRTGTTYKATLPNGWFLAVKKFHDSQDSEDLLVNELKTLGRFRHINLLPILGFCKESSERLMVYKYMSNGSLFDWLHSIDGEKKILEWSVRLKIAIGLARGLALLHHGGNFRVAHQNISSKSVLLDQNFEPKLSNFGKAGFISTDSSDDYSVSSGFWHWGFVKRDVFNFGVVLLELITGKELTSSNSFNGNLNKLMKGFSSGSCCMFDAIDRSLIGKGNDDDIVQLLTVASTCVQNLREKRPSMLDVYRSIEEIGNRYCLIEVSEILTDIAAASSRNDHCEIEIEEFS